MDLSVICPVYNNVSTMLPMLGSFQRQYVDGIDVEYIFVCNNCSDESEQVLTNITGIFKDTFKNIKIIHEDFGDTGLARQSGVDHSTGDFVIFCDMDDWLLENDMFQQLVLIGKQYPEYLFRYGFDLPKKDYFYIKDGNLGYTTYWHVINKMTCTVWRYLFPRFVFDHCKFKGGLCGKDDLDFMTQINELRNKKMLNLLITNRQFYYWDYMNPKSYSYKEMMKNQILTKKQFLDICNKIPDDKKSKDLKESLEHLL